MEGNSFKNYNKHYIIKFYFHRYITVRESKINCYKLFHAKITSTFFTRSPHYRHAKLSSHNLSISSVEWLTLINSQFLVFTILGDPGVLSGGWKKGKRASKKIGRKKVKKESRSPWDSS